MAGPENDVAFLQALQNIGVKEPVLPLAEDAQTADPSETTSRDEPAPVDTTPALSGVTAENFWRHPDAHPIALDMAVLKKYGPEWLEWEAETLRALIPQDFKTQSVSELSISKLQACRALHLVDSFWQNWEVFVACLMPFNNEFPDFRTMPVPTAAQVLVACDIGLRIRDDMLWSDEMKAYVAAVYTHEGIFLPLPPADFAHPEVPDDISATELAKRWPAVHASGKAPAGQTPVDEQLRRLLLINDYLEESRARLQQQLRFHV